jgi:hypothetical protein
MIMCAGCFWKVKVTGRPRWGATRAEEQENRRLGRLPMRNGSRPGKTYQYESANSYIFNICHTAPEDERPLFAETFCGIVYQRNFTRRKVNKSKCLYKYTPSPTLPLLPML